ncbi:MAG: DUF3256 family protein [Muribaculaceae bacterium]|nr:DUF3256 family protein [Muribaculaceae bacterium]
MKKLMILIFGLIAALTRPVSAAVVADFFVLPEADALLPFTDRDNRLDLLEYYRAEGVESRVASSLFPESILKITSLTDSAMTVSGKGVTIDIAMFLPTPGDTLIVVSTNFEVGGRTDSDVEFFDSNLHSKGFLHQPSYTEWIVPSARKNLSPRLIESVPFITSKAVLDHAECAVIFENTTETEFAESKDLFLPSVTYRYVKDKFRQMK